MQSFQRFSTACLKVRPYPRRLTAVIARESCDGLDKRRPPPTASTAGRKIEGHRISGFP